MLPLIIKTKQKTDVTAYLERQRNTSSETFLDIVEVIPEKKSLSIEEVRNIRRELHIKHPKIRIILFWDFDTATSEAQNALLKVLEDKNEEYLFVLQVTRVEPLLSTIISRSRIIDIGEKTDILVQPALLNFFQQAPGDSSLAIFADPLFQPKTREDAAVLLNELLLVLQKGLRKNPQTYAPLIKLTLDLLFKLNVYNLNHQLVIDQWLLAAKRYLK